MNTLSYKTKSAKKEEVQRNWYVVDAQSDVVGRLATKIATVLRGKHKANYTPHVDTGDYVIVINADKVRFSGNKMDQKEYQRYSGYPGGQKKRTAAEMLEKKPTEPSCLDRLDLLNLLLILLLVLLMLSVSTVLTVDETSLLCNVFSIISRVWTVRACKSSDDSAF